MINSVEQLKKYISVQKNMSFASLLPYVEDAADAYLKPILGKFYKDVLVWNDAIWGGQPVGSTDVETDVFTEIVKTSRRIVAVGAHYISLPELNVHTGDMGLQQSKASNDTSNPAPQWAYDSLASALSKKLFVHIETLWAQLYENRDLVPIWTQSMQFQRYNELLVRNPLEMNDLAGLSGSTRLYMALRPFLLATERDYLNVPTCGITNIELEGLRQRMTAGNLTPAQKNAMRDIRSFVAWQSLCDAIQVLDIQFDGAGFSLSIETLATRKNAKLDSERFKRLEVLAKNKAEMYKQKVLELYKKPLEMPKNENDNHIGFHISGMSLGVF